jgi:fused signal recognition particle receptor
MFNFIKKALTKIYSQFSSKLQTIFSRQTIDDETLKELETILISADAGIHTTRTIIASLKQAVMQQKITTGQEIKHALAIELKKLLATKNFDSEGDIYLLIGINGSGKTTFAAKLGNWLKNTNKKILFVAADTFRAAAVEQLTNWAETLSIPIVTGNENQEPASVVFQGCQRFLEEGFDIAVIDTAGRLHTKSNLMKELEKIKRIIHKQFPHKKVITLLTVDAMLGQSSLDQAKIFHESTPIDGIVLTKMDGTGKGGIVFSIVQQLHIPIAFISYGEQPDQLKLFNSEEYVNDLLQS